MVKSKFSFFQMQVESSSGYYVELLQPAFSITPERFNAIDMILTPSKLVGTVVHPFTIEIFSTTGDPTTTLGLTISYMTSF